MTGWLNLGDRSRSVPWLSVVFRGAPFCFRKFRTPFPIGVGEGRSVGKGAPGAKNIRKFGRGPPKCGGFQGGLAEFRRSAAVVLLFLLSVRNFLGISYICTFYFPYLRFLLHHRVNCSYSAIAISHLYYCVVCFFYAHASFCSVLACIVFVVVCSIYMSYYCARLYL